MVRVMPEQRMSRALGLLARAAQYTFLPNARGSFYILQVPQTFLVFCNLALAILHMRLSPVQAISMGSASATVPECRMHYTPQTNSNCLITNCYIIHVNNI